MLRADARLLRVCLTLAVCALSITVASTASPRASAAPDGGRLEGIPDLPAFDVVRLSEGAQWLASGEGKMGLGAGHLRSHGVASPNVIAADSVHSYDALHY